MSTATVKPALASPPRGPVIRPAPPPPAMPQRRTISDSQSSPVKLKRIPANLTEIRTLSEATDKTVDQNFTRDHLSVPPPREVWWNDHCNTLVTGIQGIKNGSEIQMYPMLCELLTGISERVHASLPIASRPKNPIIFLDHHKHSPTCHPEQGVQTKPDILAVYGPSSNYKLSKNSPPLHEGVPWHNIISCVEPKPTVNPRVQLTSYAWDHMTARPDMPGVYGLGVRASGYEILWSDASGIIASPLISWDSGCGALAGYIYSLYIPPSGHFTTDPSIESNDKTDSTKPATWTIRAHGNVYQNCRLLFFGPSWGRRTFVWVGTLDGESVIIKDAFRDNARRFAEGQLLKDIHSGSFVPGVVRLMNWGFVSCDRGDIATVKRPSLNAPYRKKTRLVLGSVGTRLKESKSVVDLLKAVYDVIEVHQFVSAERKVLHRDMSVYNIRMYPKHHKQVQKDIIQNKLKFIDDVLKVAADPDGDTSRCLLIDWDNSSGPTIFDHRTHDYNTTELEQSDNRDVPNGSVDEVKLTATPLTAQDSIKELATRTGTPTYIARSVAAGSFLRGTSARSFPPMPELRGKAKELYIEAHGQSVYDSYSDTAGTSHGGHLRRLDQPPGLFLHRPDHDIESVFWTLLSSVLRVYPSDGPHETNTSPRFQAAIKNLDSHVIDCTEDDSRLTFTSWEEEDFHAALHPRLTTLAPMLQQMALQIQPEYAYLLPSPRMEHLHEAMRRLLLQQIVDMGDDVIPLDPKKERVPIVDGKPINQSRGTKRMYGTPEVLEMVELSHHSKRSKADTEFFATV